MNTILKILLQLAMGALSQVVPALGGLLGGPFGWLASWALGIAVNWGYSLIAYWMKRIGINQDEIDDVTAAQNATKLWVQLEGMTNVSQADRDKVLQAFILAHVNLGRIKLR